MRIAVDDDLCEFHGQCAVVASAVFELTDDTVNYPEEVPADQQAAVRTAVKVCPQLAITVLED